HRVCKISPEGYFFTQTSDVEWRRIPRLLPGASTSSTLQIPAPSRAPVILPVLDDHFAARHHQLGVTLDREALKHGIVHLHVMCFGADHMIRLRIPDHDIGVT